MDQSIKHIWLKEISWPVMDVQRLMSFLPCFSLLVDSGCQLKCSSPSGLTVNLGVLSISVELSINTLVALLSGLVVNAACFDEDCHVLNMADYAPPSDQVSDDSITNIKYFSS